MIIINCKCDNTRNYTHILHDHFTTSWKMQGDKDNYDLITLITWHYNCGLLTVKCGKMTKFPSKCTKTQNPKPKNLKFKGVPGTFRLREYHHWIPEPILAQNGFDSPPLNPNRGLRGRNRPLPGTDHWAKKKYNIDYDVINGRKYLKRLTLHMIHSAHDKYLRLSEKRIIKVQIF